MGIPPEKFNHLFLNFSKIKENSIENKNGVGLGLSICKNLIEQMGGSVKVKSEVGRGTQFDISFHTECSIDDISQYNIGNIYEEASSVRHEGFEISNHESPLISDSLNLLEEPRDESLRNMLLVNDDCFILLGLKGRFRKHFNISTADNGYAAINQVQKKGKNFFSFIIMDIHMPIMGGIEASNKIYDFLNDRNVQSQISPGKNLNNKVLTKIFAYTSDLSEMAIQDIILRGKFNDILYSLSNS